VEAHLNGGEIKERKKRTRDTISIRGGQSDITVSVGGRLYQKGGKVTIRVGLHGLSKYSRNGRRIENKRGSRAVKAGPKLRKNLGKLSCHSHHYKN